MNIFRKVLDGVLFWVAKINGLVIGSIHQGIQSLDQISDVLKTTSLRSISINRHGFVLQCLNDKIAHNPPIIGMHPGSKSVEDPRHPHIHVILIAIAVHHSLGHTFALIVA